MMLHKRILLFAFTLLSIAGYGLFVFAAAPTGGYIPGETLDPDCLPGDTDCLVNLFVTTDPNYTWVGTNTGQNGGSTNNTVFIGIESGDGATDADYSNFIGTQAGLNAINASNSNFFGQLAGCNATNANDANFFGFEAGCYATNANNSNFFGRRAGYSATNADHSTFFGDLAGYQAASAYSSTFIGASAGYQAVNAYYSSFFGRDAGSGATGADNSTFIGYQTGMGATGASNSFFAGNLSGYNATGASNATFIGTGAGYQAYGAEHSLFVGFQAGGNSNNTPDFLGPTSNIYGATGLSNFIGYQAGFNASGVVASTFVGVLSGYQAANAYGSVFLGNGSGSLATNAEVSIFVGNNAGQSATNAERSIFIGNKSGMNASDANKSVFVGTNAGYSANNAYQSIFIGSSSGNNADNAQFSTFVGFDSGSGATDASNSVFIGHNAGWGAEYGANSIFIGPNAGIDDTVMNTQATVSYGSLTGTFQIGELVTDSNTGGSFYIFGDNGSMLSIDKATIISLNPGDTIVGGVSGATAVITSTSPGSYSIAIGENAHAAGHTNSIALGANAQNTSSYQFMIGSSAFPIDEVYIQQSGGTNCTITVIGPACTSDERLKTNIADLSSTILDTLTKVRTVTYNWKSKPTGERVVGFLAQDLEQYFPELVDTDSKGQKSVYYASMTPILVEAVRELNLKLTTIESTANTLNPTLIESLKNWLADTGNGIATIVANTFTGHRVQVDELCVGTTCLNQLQIDQIINQVNHSGTVVVNSDNQNNQGQGSGSDSSSTSSDNVNPDSGSSTDSGGLSGDNSINSDPEGTQDTGSGAVTNSEALGSGSGNGELGVSGNSVTGSGGDASY